MTREKTSILYNHSPYVSKAESVKEADQGFDGSEQIA